MTKLIFFYYLNFLRCGFWVKLNTVFTLSFVGFLNEKKKKTEKVFIILRMKHKKVSISLLSIRDFAFNNVEKRFLLNSYHARVPET